MEKNFVYNNTICKILGEHYTGLKQWYKKCADSKSDYLVFVVRRAYVLAQIMERATGLKMEHEQSIILTEGGLFLNAENFLNYYRKYKRFPSITIIDDVVMHGRALNHIVACMLKKLRTNLRNDEYQSEVLYSFVASLKIIVYARTDSANLLDDLLAERLSYQVFLRAEQWRELSKNISHLIQVLGCPNVAYTVTEYLDAEKKQKIAPVILQYINANNCILNSHNSTEENKYTRLFTYKAWHGASTWFHGVHEMAFHKYYVRDGAIFAIGTVRIVSEVKSELLDYDKIETQPVIIPSIILPNMDSMDTIMLLAHILKRIDNAALVNWLKWLENQPEKRGFNEAVTIMLSTALLYEFCCDIGLTQANDDGFFCIEDEIKKIACNFVVPLSENENTNIKTETYKMIRLLLQNSMKLKGHLDEILTQIPHSEYMKLIYFTSENSIDLNFSRKNITGAVIRKALLEEKDAVLSENIKNSTQGTTLKRKVCICYSFLREVLNNKTLQEMDYEIALFYQMVDGGLFSVSSYAPYNMRVEGFSEFCKAGEWTLGILPYEEREYSPLLRWIEKFTAHSRRSIKENFIIYVNSGMSDLKMSDVQRIKNYIDYLEEIGQSVNYWRFLEETFYPEERKLAREHENHYKSFLGLLN